MKLLKALQTRLFISLYRSHCTEMLQSHCYETVVIVYLAMIAITSLCVIAAKFTMFAIFLHKSCSPR